MNATTGTNTAIWGNYFLALLTGAVGLIDPAMLTAVLGKFGFLAMPIILALNGVLHGVTGNSKTSVLPGIINPPSVSSQG